MQVYLAYGLVVLIWSTTPLAIQWSNDSVSFITAVLMRMGVAAALAVVVVALLRRRLFARPGVWKAYLAASFGIFPNMLVVYWSAQFIPSGLIAVIFALSPFVTGMLSWLILRENPFSLRRIIALLVALTGLCIIFWDQLHIDARSALGIGGILLSCGLFSLSSVSLKRLDQGAGPLEQTAGALLFALPGLVLCWWRWSGTSGSVHQKSDRFGVSGHPGFTAWLHPVLFCVAAPDAQRRLADHPDDTGTGPVAGNLCGG